MDYLAQLKCYYYMIILYYIPRQFNDNYLRLINNKTNYRIFIIINLNINLRHTYLSQLFKKIFNKNSDKQGFITYIFFFFLTNRIEF